MGESAGYLWDILSVQQNTATTIQTSYTTYTESGPRARYDITVTLKVSATGCGLFSLQ